MTGDQREQTFEVAAAGTSVRVKVLLDGTEGRPGAEITGRLLSTNDAGGTRPVRLTLDGQTREYRQPDTFFGFGSGEQPLVQRPVSEADRLTGHLTFNARSGRLEATAPPPTAPDPSRSVIWKCRPSINP